MERTGHVCGQEMGDKQPARGHFFPQQPLRQPGSPRRAKALSSITLQILLEGCLLLPGAARPGGGGPMGPSARSSSSLWGCREAVGVQPRVPEGWEGGLDSCPAPHGVSRGPCPGSTGVPQASCPAEGGLASCIPHHGPTSCTPRPTSSRYSTPTPFRPAHSSSPRGSAFSSPLDSHPQRPRAQ